MARYKRFTFACNQEERQLIEKLAKYLGRSQSDAVRSTVIDMAKVLLPKEVDPAGRPGLDDHGRENPNGLPT